MPAPGQTEPFYGPFTAFKTMAAENNDFNIDFGDTIYSDPEIAGVPTASTVAQKWAYYRKKMSVENMQKIREATGLYNHWDDHEFINDFSIPEDGRALYDRSVQAFRNYMPVTFSNKNGIYRTARWGKNLELFFLDERSFRSAKASANHACDNPRHGPAGSGPHRAAEHPQRRSRRWCRRFRSPSRRRCKNTINSSKRTFLGSHQLNRFISEVKHSNAKLEGGHERDPDPAVLRAAVRPLGGLRVRAREALEGAPERERETTSRSSPPTRTPRSRTSSTTAP